MTGLQLALAHASKIAMVVLLAGIIVRRRAGLCWVLPAYLVAALIGNTLPTAWPERFYNQSFWMLKQAVYDVMKFAIGLELAYRAFRAFPGTWRTARLVLTSVIVLSGAAIVVATRDADYSRLWAWQPSISTAAVWLLTATALIVVWYQLPIHDWQRAIMLGFALYLLVFVSGLGMLRRAGWRHSSFGVVDAVAFLSMVSIWSWLAWRRDKPHELLLKRVA